MRAPVAFARQRGMAVLAVSAIMLFLITVMTFYANKGAVLEQKMSANQLQYQQAYEAAQGGVDYSMAWLTDGVNLSTAAWTAAAGTAGAMWVCDPAPCGTLPLTYPPYDQKNIGSITAPAMGTYTGAVSVTLWRNSAKKTVVEISSTSTGDATATIKQTLNVLALSFNHPSTSPWLVNGCISGVTGTPNVVGTVSGIAVTTSNTPACANNIPTGMAPATTVAGNSFTGTAWDYTFGMSKTDMLALASNQPSGATGGPIYYYTTFPNTFSTSLGTPNSPVILIFDGACPTINGGAIVYGIVYCTTGGNMPGWGGTKIFGSLITDSSITQFSAGTQFSPNPNAFTPGNYNVPPVVSKVTGSWRDF